MSDPSFEQLRGRVAMEARELDESHQELLA